MCSGIWYLTCNSLKILSLIDGRNLLTAQFAGRIKGRLSPGPAETPSLDPSPSSPSSSSPSSPSGVSPPLTQLSSFPTSILPPHSPQHNTHPHRQGTGLTSLSLTKVRNPQTQHLNRRPRRSPLLHGLTTPHSLRHLTSDYLQVMDPI